MRETICYAPKEWNEIDPQDWPNVEGTIFVTFDKSAMSNGPVFLVHEWIDSDIENVKTLGKFWTMEDAVLFANAKAAKGE